MKRIIVLAIFWLLLISQISLGASENLALCSPLKGKVYYTVQAQDRLSDIVLTFGLKPLWDARRGFVGKVALQNQLKNPNLIFPGDIISLPFRCEEDLAKYVLVETKLGREINPRYLVRVKTNLRHKGEFQAVLVYPDQREVPLL